MVGLRRHRGSREPLPLWPVPVPVPVPAPDSSGTGWLVALAPEGDAGQDGRMSDVAATLRLRITPETLRVEVDDEVVLEEEAAIAFSYEARAEDAAVIAVGDGTRELPEQIRTFDWSAEPDPRLRRAVLVPVDEAAWYRPLATGDETKRPEYENPWDHQGEIVNVHPFAPGEGSVRTWLVFLHFFRFHLFHGRRARRIGFFRLWWIRLFGRVEVVIPELPEDDRLHDDLVRGLRGVFGGRVMLNGAPARVRSAARRPLRDWLPIAAPSAILVLILAARSTFGAPVWFNGLGFITSLVGGLSLFAAWRELRAGPSAPTVRPPSPRALHRRVDAGPDADPRAFAGPRETWLSADDTGDFLGMIPPLALVAWPVVAAWFRFWGPRPGPVFLVALAVLALGGFLATRPRISLGERGITVRPRGLLGRPFRIPHGRIRHVALRRGENDAPQLAILFRGGGELVIGYRLRTRRRAARMEELESALLDRLHGAGSYREPGARVVG